MAKVTSKLQLTVPKVIADEYGIKPGDQLDWVPAGDVDPGHSCQIPAQPVPLRSVEERVELFAKCWSGSANATSIQPGGEELRFQPSAHPNPTKSSAAGDARISTTVAALVDTNILVYRFDPSSPRKQAIATQLLRQGLKEGSIRLPHQAIIEFVAAATRSRAGQGPLDVPACGVPRSGGTAHPVHGLVSPRCPGAHSPSRGRRVSAFLVRCSPLGLC